MKSETHNGTQTTESGTMTTKTYFQRFFEEKELDHERMFEIEAASGLNLIPVGVVIEAIKTTTETEAAKIADTLRRIDFANGDVYDYLKHLAGALAF